MYLLAVGHPEIEFSSTLASKKEPSPTCHYDYRCLSRVPQRNEEPEHEADETRVLQRHRIDAWLLLLLPSPRSVLLPLPFSGSLLLLSLPTSASINSLCFTSVSKKYASTDMRNRGFASIWSRTTRCGASQHRHKYAAVSAQT